MKIHSSPMCHSVCKVGLPKFSFPNRPIPSRESPRDLFADFGNFGNKLFLLLPHSEAYLAHEVHPRKLLLKKRLLRSEIGKNSPLLEKSNTNEA